jgi:electron transport complex protein RnfB
MTDEIWLPQVDKTLCTGCGDCVAVCPTAALGLSSGLAILVEPAVCNYCADCETICPVKAIALPYQIVLESRL